MMKRKLMRMAMSFVAELAEDIFPDDDAMTVERFIELTDTEFIYDEVNDGSRIDAILTVTQHGEMEATFKICIAR